MKIMILTAATGGGHDSVAEAVAEALQPYQAGGVGACIAAPLGGIVDAAYGWALNRAPALWGASYRATDRERTAALCAGLLAAARSARLAELILAERPDLILSVHALCARLAVRTLRRLRLAIPHHCVVTDLVDIHRCWFSPEIDTYYAGTHPARRTLLRGGIAPGRVIVSGIPVRQQFRPPVLQVLRRTGLPPQAEGGTHGPPDHGLRVLLLDGGTPGPALLRAARALLLAGPPLRLTLAWGRIGPPEPPAYLGSTGDCAVQHLPRGAAIAPQMLAADLVVTKAGSVTIAEALALGRPLLLHRAAPGQEAGNPGYLAAAGAGLFAPTAAGLAAAVRRLACVPEARAALAARAAALGRPDAAAIVAAHLIDSLAGVPRGIARDAAS